LGSGPDVEFREILTPIRQWRTLKTVELIETSIFTKQVAALLSDDAYRAFQNRIAANPEIGALIRGGGGVRKVRIAVGSRGKSGGARVIYYWAVRQNVILLLFAYLKNEVADLTPKQVAQLAKVVKEEFGNESTDV
jgi:mRNA-degrading endonuclease RelE of RelBE toxin-antitoxin system